MTHPTLSDMLTTWREAVVDALVKGGADRGVQERAFDEYERAVRADERRETMARGETQ